MGDEMVILVSMQGKESGLLWRDLASNLLFEVWTKSSPPETHQSKSVKHWVHGPEAHPLFVAEVNPSALPHRGQNWSALCRPTVERISFVLLPPSFSMRWFTADQFKWPRRVSLRGIDAWKFIFGLRSMLVLWEYCRTATIAIAFLDILSVNNWKT